MLWRFLITVAVAVVIVILVVIVVAVLVLLPVLYRAFDGPVLSWDLVPLWA